MEPFKKILVAVDFSAHAERALEDACLLAKTGGAQIHLVHVVYLPIQSSLPEMAVTPADLIGEMRNDASKRLDKLAGQVRQQGVECHMSLTDGVPSQAIHEEVGRLGADLVVIGTRGMSALEHVVLGSVAERVVRTAPCPVMTVQADGPPLKLARLLVPTDFSETANHALELARALVAAGDEGHLVLAHAQHIPIDVMQFLVQRGDQLIVEEGVPIIERISEAALAQLERILRGVQEEGTSSELVLERGAPEDVILETAEAKDVDLIVMGTHGRRGISHLVLGSVAERVVRASKRPVLTVRAPE